MPTVALTGAAGAIGSVTAEVFDDAGGDGADGPGGSGEGNGGHDGRSVLTKSSACAPSTYRLDASWSTGRAVSFVDGRSIEVAELLGTPHAVEILDLPIDDAAAPDAVHVVPLQGT